MRALLLVTVAMLLMMPVLPAFALARPRIIIVTVTAAYRHTSIETAEPLLATMAAERGIDTVFVRTDAEMLATFADLRGVDAVLFVNTSGELPRAAGVALVEWVRGGGTFAGVHSASDTFHDYADYVDMLGAEFDHHPPETNAAVVVDDPSHLATATLPPSHVVYEEFYILKRFDPSRVRMLLSLRADPEDASVAQFVPLAWEKPYGRGRVLYTALGHREDVWLSEWFRAHIAGVLDWAITPPPRVAKRRAVGH